ncbi:glycerol dehydrogenase [Natronolimnohabitans innermongolicus]|uniref:Glycerol dehydrogenase n=1 Tax=Natronolimnohabitans innermongolicus JCM 12255 TaxID=1227499 RepID=L9WNN4_9EURY|nr:glycerol dehydrogenase [Natronolimnohabitans innermongolicus]ELY50987.1 glycerol dehydrogenase [Natronolimnohabitans innermongolicus JCM 12255]
MTQVFRSPAGYVQGRNVINELGEHAADLGDSAIVLGDEFVLDLVGDRVHDNLESAGFDVALEEFNGECSEKEIERVATVHEEFGADVIVGAGGGKAIDTARAAREHTGGALVSLPTIASTDAPTSSVAVIYTEDGEFVEFHVYERHPELVIVDTEIVAQAPTRLFRGGIGDALATWFEADAAHRSGATTIFDARSTRTAQQIARLAYTTLREHGRSAVDAVENDAVTDSVEAVVEANTLLSGLGFESGGLAAAHAIHNGLTQLEATHEATHGEKVTVGTISQLVLEGRDDAFVEEVAGFASSVGLPTTLGEIGLEDPDPDELEVVAEAACAEDETIHNEPFPVSPADVRDAIVGADAIGRRLSADGGR